MALQRPLKEGNVRTYQEKVALNFKDILASEADADHDTMYAAWNGALGGDLTGTLPSPTVTAAAKSKWSDTGTTLTPTPAAYANKVIFDTAGNPTFAGGTFRLYTGATSTESTTRILTPATFTANYNYSGGWVRDNTAKPGWSLRLDPGPDSCVVGRDAGSGTLNLLVVDNAGNLNLPGGLETKVVLGSATAKTRLSQIGGLDMAYWGYNISWSGSAWTRDDATKGACWLYAQSSGANQNLVLNYLSTTGVSTAPFQIDNGANLVITGSVGQKASGTTWSNPSDPRLKRDVEPYVRGLLDVCALEPIAYHLKAQPDGPWCYGFDATAVRDVFPECVSTTRMKLDPADEEETDDVLVFDMHPILVALVNAVRELAAKVAP